MNLINIIEVYISFNFIRAFINLLWEKKIDQDPDLRIKTIAVIKIIDNKNNIDNIETTEKIEIALEISTITQIEMIATAKVSKNNAQDKKYF